MTTSEIAVVLLVYAYLMVGLWIAAITIPDTDDTGERFVKGSALTIGWIPWLLARWISRLSQKTFNLAKGLLLSILAG